MKEKIKNFIQNEKRALTFGLSGGLSSAVLAVSTSAAEGSSVSEMNTAITGALSDFSVTNLAAVFVAGLGVAIPLILGWFAFRWVFRKAKGALKRGS